MPCLIVSMKHFELLRVSNRDNYATIMRQLDHLIEFAYFPRLKNDVRRQVRIRALKLIVPY